MLPTSRAPEVLQLLHHMPTASGRATAGGEAYCAAALYGQRYCAASYVVRLQQVRHMVTLRWQVRYLRSSQLTRGTGGPQIRGVSRWGPTGGVPGRGPREGPQELRGVWRAQIWTPFDTSLRNPDFPARVVQGSSGQTPEAKSPSNGISGDPGGMESPARHVQAISGVWAETPKIGPKRMDLRTPKRGPKPRGFHTTRARGYIY